MKKTNFQILYKLKIYFLFILDAIFFFNHNHKINHTKISKAVYPSVIT